MIIMTITDDSMHVTENTMMRSPLYAITLLFRTAPGCQHYFRADSACTMMLLFITLMP